MYNFFLLCFLLASPVLYEGRYRPLETVPPGAHYTPLEVEDYAAVAGTVYLQAEGKALKFPTFGQLSVERLLHFVPFKWIIISSYLLAAILFSRYQRLGWASLCIGFVLHTAILALRCYVLGRPPVSNMAETILYVPWIAIVAGFIFHPRAAVLAAAAILLFLPARVGLENVQAVLDSQYWLIVHVLMVVGSYGTFCLAGVLGHLLLIQKKPPYTLEKALVQIMYLGTALLIGGTILGGVWAAQSWGRFWDWDPKEAWAFISSGVYLIWIHAYRFKKIGPRGLAVGSIVGLMAITFTWYGVNYILGSGLHSYGFGHGGEIYYYLYLGAEVFFMASLELKHRIYRKSED